MSVNRKEEVACIEEYVRVYNSFDIKGMVELLHPDIVFRNVANGEVTIETHGIEPFQQLAQQSAGLFSSRRQTILQYIESDGRIEVDIDYEGSLAVDLPNGLKAGDKIQLTGKTIFTFTNGKISSIEDHS
ncbi:nuclear transport factor 2 family protein [Paenibacillus sp. UNC217MF]|uniref:nuclear transport factor 2 family protein n=1 Tax=Paenibacillus sp. UNC217MF TaxID=1449062 RepID=UPI00048E5195|nr:nuclear transport factor 2 family protein [Paenibacillus sp. UNC217MF]